MPKALIIGAGIGGLAAGIALRQASWDVEIFERAADQLQNPIAVRLRNFAFQFVTPRLQTSQLAGIVGHKV